MQRQVGGRVGRVAAAVADQARHPVDAVEGGRRVVDAGEPPQVEPAYRAAAGVVVQHQRRAAVDGLGQHAAVVHARAGGVAGRARGRVEHEEAGVDRGGRAAGPGQLRGGLAVVEVGAEGAGELAVERRGSIRSTLTCHGPRSEASPSQPV